MQVKRQNDTWISSSFDAVGVKVSRTEPATKLKSAKKSLQQSARSTSRKCPTATAELWADKHQPTCQGDLAVHKRKVQELQDWLEHSRNQRHVQAPILLLTGPAGTGKTATLRVLASEKSMSVQEWQNPTQQSYDPSSVFTSDVRRVEGSMFVSQTAQFQDFLLRANRYRSLDIFQETRSSHRLILVEEFPNVFFRDASLFHDILRSYQHRGHCPLVFIISDSVSGESNERILFPRELQSEMSITSISFNPVAITSLVKVLNRVAMVESQRDARLRVPSKTVIEGLAAASAGDVRAAINALQFACLRDTVDLDITLSSVKPSTSHKSSKSRARGQTAKRQRPNTDSDLAAIGCRDSSLFLFRALGKILYCKREQRTGDEESLPPHLSHLQRDPLVEHAEDVVEKAQVSGDFFTSYLHQNYLDFFNDINDVLLATEYFSCADHLSTEWTSRSVLREYAASVATRAVMFTNTSHTASSGKTKGKTSGLGWKPLHKPDWFSVNKKWRRNREMAAYLFRGTSWRPEELHISVLPYIRHIGTRLNKPGQMTYLHENRIGKSLNRGQRLKEDDFTMESDDESQNYVACVADSTDSSGPSTAPTAEQPPDEQYLIEDFDD